MTKRHEFFVPAHEWEEQQQKTLSDRCQEIYEEKGQYAVYDYVRENHPEVLWSDCKPCEDSTPTDPNDNACLVCGSPKGDK